MLVVSGRNNVTMTANKAIDPNIINVAVQLKSNNSTNMVIPSIHPKYPMTIKKLMAVDLISVQNNSEIQVLPGIHAAAVNEIKIHDKILVLNKLSNNHIKKMLNPHIVAIIQNNNFRPTRLISKMHKIVNGIHSTLAINRLIITAFKLSLL